MKLINIIKEIEDGNHSYKLVKLNLNKINRDYYYDEELNHHQLIWNPIFQVNNEKIKKFKIKFSFYQKDIFKNDISKIEVECLSTNDIDSQIYNYKENQYFLNYLYLKFFKRFGFKLIINNNFSKMVLKVPSFIFKKINILDNDKMTWKYLVDIICKMIYKFQYSI